MSSAPSGDPVPNPFSREGSDTGGVGWPLQPPPEAAPPAEPYVPPPYEPPPYEPPPYEPPAYEPQPYDPVAATYAPYAPPVQHPQAVTAMVLGVVGLVLSLACGLGGLVGIGGVVLGRRARHDIDADPARYEGRNLATAGLVTGVVALVVGGLWLVLAVVLGLIGKMTG